ncbi:MAG: zf-HC2 domain-containing protein [Planctomycetota bacterium]
MRQDASTDTAEDMACEDVEACLPLVADGSLTASDDPDLFTHLATCSRCQESLAVHDLVGLTLDTGAAARHRARVASFRLPGRLAAAAAALLVLGVGIWALDADGAQDDVASATTDQPKARVLRVIDPGPGHSRPRYLIRSEGREFVVEHVDGRMPEASDQPGENDASEPMLVPVHDR